MHVSKHLSHYLLVAQEKNIGIRTTTTTMTTTTTNPKHYTLERPDNIFSESCFLIFLCMYVFKALILIPVG